MQRFRFLSLFLVLAALVTIIAGTIYVSGQQIYRMSANDPQVEASQIITEAIEQGAPAEAIAGQGGTTDIAKSLSPFVIVFDKDGKMLASTGKLGDQTPTPPSSVIDAARKSGEHRLTWEPQKGVRVAGVIRKANDDKGFVLVGRNLKETENRIKNLMYIIGIAWIGMLIMSAILAWLLSRMASGITLVEETNVIEVEPTTTDNEPSQMQ